MSEKLVLIDGHSILNRAFFGLPDLTNSQGVHTNAVYGFLNIMFKILEEEQPDYLTVAFDVHAPTFRHKMYDVYKGTRKPMADELRQQVPLIKEMLSAMGVTIVEKEGYEADDILGTIAGMGEKAGMDVAIISGDRDLLQLATEHVMIRIPKTKKGGTEIENYLAADVVEKYQVTPKEFIDVKALQGDTADNIPGVPGIGEKTASALINQYHSIEAVHEHAAEVKPPRAGKNIVEYWEQAVMSKELATIITDVPLEYDFANAKLESNEVLYTQEAYMLCKQLEFKNLLSRFEVDAPKNNAEEFFTVVETRDEAEHIWKRAKGKKVAFSFVQGESKPASEEGQISLFDEPIMNKYAAMSLVFGEEDIYFFKTGNEITSDYLSGKLEELDAQMYISPDLKPALSFFDPMNGRDIAENWDLYIDIRNKYFDMTVAAYLLNPLKGEYPYEDIAKDYLGLMFMSKKDYLGKESASSMIETDCQKVVKYACFEAYTAWKSQPVLEETLKEKAMLSLFREI